MSSPAAKSRLLTIGEVAERLRISKRSAYRLAEDIGREPGGPMRFSETAVERYIASKMRGHWTDGRVPLAQLLVDEAVAALAALPSCCWTDGIVYFVAHGPLIKIGRSKTAKIGSRMANLQCQSPVPLRLVRLSRGYALEQTLHERLRHDRAHGEWFWADAVQALLVDAGDCVRCFIEGSAAQ